MKPPKSKKLTKRQLDALKKHSVNHSAKHMAEMKKLMRNGATFGEAHRMAMKKKGRWNVPRQEKGQKEKGRNER